MESEYESGSESESDSETEDVSGFTSHDKNLINFADVFRWLLIL